MLVFLRVFFQLLRLQGAVGWTTGIRGGKNYSTPNTPNGFGNPSSGRPPVRKDPASGLGSELELALRQTDRPTRRRP